MTRAPVRLRAGGRPFLDIWSLGRVGPSGRFTIAQIEQIRRTVSRVPEVMVKVTGGGAKVGAVAAHLAYISRKGELEIETDDGTLVTGKDEQKALLKDWHLELSAGQYRGRRDGRAAARTTKLVQNVVLSMPSPPPPEKVLAAARNFAREKFGIRHRYAIVLHTDQRHPHVHMVVKAESEHGRRLHVDKEILREWREDFARMMREQGIATNATPRMVRGQNKGKTRDAIYRAQQRGESRALRERVTSAAQELARTRTVRDPARDTLLNSRKVLIAGWTMIADALDAQEEIALAGDVRYFVRHLPPVLTDKERLAVNLVRHKEGRRYEALRGTEPPNRDRSDDFAR